MASDSSIFSTRLVTDDDQDLVLSWRNHPDVRANMLSSHEIQLDEHLTWWNKNKGNSERRTLFLLLNNKPVAVFYFYQIKKNTAWWGFYLNNKRLTISAERLKIWIATENTVEKYAKEVLQVSEIYSETLFKNESVILLHKNHNFEVFDPPIDQLTKTQKSVVYMKKQINDVLQPVFFLGSSNLEIFSDAYSKVLHNYSELKQTVERVPFGQYQALIFDSASRLRQQKNGCFVFCERVEDFFEHPFSLPNCSSVDYLVSKFDDYLKLIHDARVLLDGEFVIADLALMQRYPAPIVSMLQRGVLENTINQCNQKIYELAESLQDVRVLTYQENLKKIGQNSANPKKFWALGRFPWSHVFTESLSSILIGQQLATKEIATRVIVLDLDNTLWGGIVGDDGLDGIKLGGDYPGNVFLQLQQLFFAYKKLGILLAICSKNTDEIAWRIVAEHPEMYLSQSDFSARRINWNSKSENIKEIAKELNLGLNSFCFIDDNPVERQEVRFNLPNVFVPELPNEIADWLNFLINLPELSIYSLTSSDIKRSEQYRLQAELKETEKRYKTKDDFLKSLQMKIFLQPYSTYNKVRVIQLLQKTNQFNTTTRRQNESDIKCFLSSGGEVWLVGLSDKYNNSPENIAVLFFRKEKSSFVIDSFVMSCRVMGRKIENKLIYWIANYAKSQGFNYLDGEIIKTKRNNPIQTLYSDRGFTQISNQNYRLSLDNYDHLRSLENICSLEQLCAGNKNA